MTPPSPDWSSLLPALLDFERSPGRYRVVLREPRPLFEHTLAVLQLAVGRSVDGLADLAHEPAQTDELKRAARFFVRTVLLRPGVDHYTLLGLAPGCEADELREHYRLMIRLTHPDFAAGSGEAWPADAATRINQANDVLSSFERRSDYNAAQASAQPVASAAAGAAAASAKVAQKKPATPRSRVLTLRPKKDADAAADRTGPRVPRGVKIALASLGALGAATALLLNGPAGDSGSLAVRKLPSVANPTLQAETSLVLVGGAASEAQVDTAPAPAPAPVAEPEPVAPQPKPRRPRTNRELAAAKAAEGSASGAPSEAALSLTMDTRMVVTPTPVAMPVSMTVAAAVPAPAPRAAAPAPAALPAEPAAPSASRATLPAPTLAQVQPALSNLVASLPSGRGENMAQWIDSGFRAHPDTGRFVGRFNQLLAGLRVTQLGHVRFSSRTQGVQLVVDGVIVLHTQDMNNEARVRDLHLRAFFQPQDGQPVLTHLVAEKLQ
ncbi:J domain-containing protein [Hydrogenophaga sp. D2P1]|uniref:J domain-containing protein n=1 Tax=Hydrogenophaga aromaticivorans TaxID=2610898 RepID=A0A7Y8GSW4_9BURK|nr:J domain-containing protein [Hydrogenophaga aromaticivorans]NWF44255.1 J domain-containing protein [Hydrogenophaga aromaticivorans]